MSRLAAKPVGQTQRSGRGASKGPPATVAPPGFSDYPVCECDKPYAVYITEKRGVFKGVALGGRRLCHICHGRVTLGRKP